MSRPILLGHRGARAFRQIPENTLASFELCLQHGCDGFEFDVRRSSDGQAVVCHDATWDGLEIQHTAANILALPSLENVLRQFAARAFVDIELKVAGLERATLDEIGKHTLNEGYVVSSFLPDVLNTIYELDPEIPLGFLCDQRDQLRSFHQMPSEWVIPQRKLVDGELIESVHAAGKKIMVWTVNRETDMRALADWGADAIISDETELLVHSLGSCD